MDDAELIKDYLRTKSSSASFALVAKYQQAVFGLCYRVLSNASEAEEAAQDSFMKFFEALDQLEDPQKLKSWLMSIAYRSAVDYHRKRKPLAKGMDELRENELADTGNPADYLQGKQRRALLERLFAQLNDLDKAILTCYYIEDMPVKLVAETLGQSKSNVKIRLMRSRETLRKKMTGSLRKDLES